MPEPVKRGRRYMPGLDGLRAIAVLAVIAYHLGIGWMPGGLLGVGVFFTLSGYLITDLLLAQVDAGEIRLGSFWLARARRLLPALIVMLVVVMAWVTVVGPHQPPDFRHAVLSAAVYVNNWWQIFHDVSYFAQFEAPAPLNHLWSLSVEEQFYIVWPLVLILTPNEKLKPMFLTAIALGPILRWIVYLAYQSQAFPALLAPPHLAVYVLPFSHIDAFAFGAYVSQFPLPKPRIQLAALAVVIPALGFGTQYLTRGEIRLDTLGYEFMLTGSYKFVWAYSLLNYFFALTIHAVHRTGMWLNFLETPIMRYLGKISYGMYVYHYAVIWFIVQAQNKSRETLDLSINYGMGRTYLLALTATTLIAAISFRFLEKPINDLKDRYFPAR